MKRVLVTLTALALAAGLALPALAAPATGALPEVMATVDGKPISKEQVLAVAGPKLMQIRQDEYQVLENAIRQLVEQRLIESAAEAAGQSLEDYLGAEIEEKVGEPEESELRAIYERFKNTQSLAGKSFEEVRPQLRDYARGQEAQRLYTELVERLQAQAKVDVALAPPRFEVSPDDDPAVGPKGAPVTIISFSDYECPYCARAEATVRAVRERYGDKVRVVYRDFPLDFHQNALKAAEAAGCAAEQDRFLAMHDKLFENQRALGSEQLMSYARELELDMEAFESCMTSGRRAEEVRADLAAGSAHGVSGTPAFFINGRFLNGAQPIEAFAKIIDEELGDDAPAAGAATP